VRRAALAGGPPGMGGSVPFSLEGKTYAKPDDRPTAVQIIATPGYFDVLGVAARQGRLFTLADTDATERVAVVDEAFVDTHLGGGPALGRRLRFDDKNPWITIVGVVPSLVQADRPNQVLESVFVPFAQSPQRFAGILANTGDDPTAVTSGIRSALLAVSPETPLANANSLAA